MTTSRRPQVTLTYAQSIDGSIAARAGVPLKLSGEASRKFTHQLRAQHDAILVGIGTVLADDPQLNVRLVAGKNPRPIILDSQLRCPTTACCIGAARLTIIAASQHAPMARQRALEAVGVLVVRVPLLNQRIDLRALLERLDVENIRSLMVEGGGQVITSFLRARLVDRVILTIAPTIIGGVRGVNELVGARLRNVSMQQLGDDFIVSGETDWSEE